MAVKTIFYQFNMGDVEDPEIYCAGPIWDWQQTEYGRWCMTHAIELPAYDIIVDHITYGYKCTIHGMLTDPDYTFHQLKWSNHVKFNC
jgi:hypothetical protein